MDVFISYSHEDEDWVRGELLRRIEEAGVRAFIDYRDFTPGAPSIKEMARGVEECPKTLVVLTPEYIESEWCDVEVIMTQTLSPANRDLRLIPLLKAPCDKPLYVAALTHIDFTEGADQDLAWRQLLTALGKPPEPEPPKEPERDQWFLAHPYPMPPNFTGRVAEREMLSGWLDDDPEHPLLSLRALGGFGKSALVWHWLTHDVDPAAWPRVVWWSFYEGDASFDSFLAETLDYLSSGKVDAAKMGAKDAVRALSETLHEPGTLLVLDGFERVLRAFGGLDAAYLGDKGKREEKDRDCISPLAEDFLRAVGPMQHLKSKVLLTTRLCPRVLEAKGGGLLAGCREEPLEQLQPADAVAFFRAQGIRGTHTEIERACEPYGYHPLSLRLLAGLIVGDFQQPGDVAAAKRLDVSGDLVQRQHHVLEVAHDSLSPSGRAVLGRIACFRSPVAYETLQALAEEEGEGVDSTAPLDADLRNLVSRGLLHHDKQEGRFDLHPIVRRYAYDRLAEPDRAAAHRRLRDYFAAVPAPEEVTQLEDLAPVIELYHHTVRAGQFDEAQRLFVDRLDTPTYYQFGAYQLQIELLSLLFPEGEDHPPPLKDENARGRARTDLACVYGLIGQPRRAVPLFEQDIALCEARSDAVNLASTIGNLAILQRAIGAMRSAEANLRRRIELCREISDDFKEAVAHQELGRVLACRGKYVESEGELATAVTMFEKQNHVQSLCVVWSYLVLLELLLLRTASETAGHNQRPTLDSAHRSLDFADQTAEDARFVYPVKDYVRIRWLLGAAHLVAGQLDEAERQLHWALERCRRINLVEFEADILIDLARLRAATSAVDEAQRLAEEARIIAERSEYVLQGADAHLELAKLARARGDEAAAREHAEEAHRLATCDGPPDYTYKAAYEEAGALLAELRS